LKILNVSHNFIRDLTPLYKLNLEDLDCSFNLVEEVKGFRQLKVGYFQFNLLKRIDLRADLEYLNLSFNDFDRYQEDDEELDEIKELCYIIVKKVKKLVMKKQSAK
jgi:Leucine-rich repeat (LRR) protein